MRVATFAAGTTEVEGALQLLVQKSTDFFMLNGTLNIMRQEQAVIANDQRREWTAAREAARTAFEALAEQIRVELATV